MSVDKHFRKRGIELTEDNTLPVGQRTQRSFKRVIAAFRAAEAEFVDELRDANERCRLSQAQVIELQSRIASLDAQLRKYRVSEQLNGLDLTIADKTKLLEAS